MLAFWQFGVLKVAMFIPTVEIMTFPFMCHMPTQNLWLCLTLTFCLRVTRGKCHCYLSDSINMMCTMINIQSNLYIKGTQGILKMYSLWAVAFIYRLKKAWRYKWGNQKPLIRIYNTMDKKKKKQHQRTLNNLQYSTPTIEEHESHWKPEGQTAPSPHVTPVVKNYNI